MDVNDVVEAFLCIQQELEQARDVSVDPNPKLESAAMHLWSLRDIVIKELSKGDKK